MQRNSPSAILIVLAAGLLWGTVGPAEILAHSPAGPVAVGGARILSGGLVLTVILLVRDPGAFRALPRAAWPALLAASAATAIFQGTFLTSAARTGCGRSHRRHLRHRAGEHRAAASGSCSAPGCRAAGCSGTRPARSRAACSSRCRSRRRRIGAGPAGEARVDIFGIACGVVAGGCFGVYTVSAKRLIHGRREHAGRGAGHAGARRRRAGALDAAGAAGTGRAALASGWSLWLGPATVALAYWLYVAGLRGLPAATAGTLSLAEPLVAAALGIGLLHERLSLAMAAGHAAAARRPHRRLGRVVPGSPPNKKRARPPRPASTWRWRGAWNTNSFWISRELCRRGPLAGGGV